MCCIESIDGVEDGQKPVLRCETERVEEIDAALHAPRAARDGPLMPGRGHGASSTATPEAAGLSSAVPGAAGHNSAAPGWRCSARRRLQRRCVARHRLLAAPERVALSPAAALGSMAPRMAALGRVAPAAAVLGKASPAWATLATGVCFLRKTCSATTETSCARRAPACLAETASSAGEGSRASSEGAVG